MVDVVSHPNTFAWFILVSRFTDKVKATWPPGVATYILACIYANPFLLKKTEEEEEILREFESRKLLLGDLFEMESFPETEEEIKQDLDDRELNEAILNDRDDLLDE